MTREEARLKAQNIVIKYANCEISDVQAVELIADALVEASKVVRRDSAPFVFDDDDEVSPRLQQTIDETRAEIKEAFEKPNADQS